MSNQVSLPEINQSNVHHICPRSEITYIALDYAHQCGMMGISVDMIQFPNESNKNTSICLATLKRADGIVFVDVGDANPNNVPQGSANCIISISSERAMYNVIINAYNIFSYLGGDFASITDDDLKNSICKSSIDMSNGQKSSNVQYANGGSSELLTDKQEKLINDLAEILDMDAQALCMIKFGKRLQSLHCSEAEKLIQYLS